MMKVLNTTTNFLSMKISVNLDDIIRVFDVILKEIDVTEMTNKIAVEI